MKWLMTLFIRNECEVLIQSEAEDCFKKTPTIILTARLSSSEVSLEKGFEAKTVKLTYRSLKSSSPSGQNCLHFELFFMKQSRTSDWFFCTKECELVKSGYIFGNLSVDFE